jgi:hypothetical protein
VHVPCPYGPCIHALPPAACPAALAAPVTMVAVVVGMVVMVVVVVAVCMVHAAAPGYSQGIWGEQPGVCGQWQHDCRSLRGILQCS